MQYHQTKYVHMVSWFLLLGLLNSIPTCFAETDDQATIEDHKRLIIFAGPRHSDSEGIKKFLYNHASDRDDGGERSPGLDGWIWPSMKELFPPNTTDSPQDVFDNLVQNSFVNETLQTEMLKEIAKAWKASTYGVIIGSEKFDDSRFGEYEGKGFEAMKRVIDYLGLPHWKVDIVMNYRFPRTDQWIEMWQNDQHKHRPMTYEEFVCEKNGLWTTLETTMNPLKLATLFLREWWRVTVIDTRGSFNDQRDLAHVFACDVLNHTGCKDGWVNDLRDVTYEKEPNVYNETAFEPLSDSAVAVLEHLFHDRDCLYQYELTRDDKFKVLHGAVMWKNCHSSNNANEWSDTGLLMNRIKEQAGCGKTKATKHTAEDISNNMAVLVIGILFLACILIFGSVILHRKRRQRKRMLEIWDHPEWVVFDQTFRTIDDEMNKAGGRNPEVASAIRNGLSVRHLKNVPTTPRGTRPNLAPYAVNSMFDDDKEDLEDVQIT